MARKHKKEVETTVDAEVAAPSPIQELPTLPGETYGLAVTAPVEAAPEPVNEPEPEVDESEGIDPQVSADISRDPRDSVAAALVATGKLYNDAGTISAALSLHLRTTAGEPELHAFLMRVQTLFGEFRHSFEQIDQGISDRLRDAIQDAVAA